MIKVLGPKRTLALLLLLAANAGMAAAVYLFMMPEQTKKQTELMAAQANITTLSDDIKNMQVEFDKLGDQRIQFDQLKAHGFFTNQDRRQAEVLLQKIQKQAGVIAAVASIQAGKVEENELAAKANHNVLKTVIKIQVDAIDPVDIYRYIYLIEHFFPGHITFDSIKMERKMEVTSALLRTITNNENPVLVKAAIEAVWTTMVPTSEVIKIDGDTGETIADQPTEPAPQ